MLNLLNGVMKLQTKEDIMGLNIYHHVQNKANQSFVCYGNRVYFQIPNFIGKLLTKNKLKGDFKSVRERR